MLLEHCTWQQIETYLTNVRGIVVPIGSIEQHGPLGLIGTDAICAEAIARGVGECGLGPRRKGAGAGDSNEQGADDPAGVLVGPTIALGSAQFNLSFPGTVSLRASTLMAVVDDYVRSLARQGFERFYFVNGHGGNIGPVRAAFQDLYASYSLSGAQCPFRCRLRSWWEYPNVDRLRKDLYGAAEGMHGTPSEVAITQYVVRVVDGSGSGSVGRPARLSSEFLRDHGGDNHWDARTHRAAFPDGRVGSDSALATVEHGRLLLEAAIADAAADYRAFLAES